MLHFSPSLVVADLDGTMLHDANAFESRYLSQETVSVSKRLRNVEFRLRLLLLDLLEVLLILFTI